MKEVEIALLLPLVLSLLVERRRKYEGGRLEVSSRDSSVDRPRVCACERVGCAGWHELGASERKRGAMRHGIGARQHELARPSRIEEERKGKTEKGRRKRKTEKEGKRKEKKNNREKEN